MGPWLPRRTHKTPPLVVEPPQQAKIPGHLGMMDRSTPHLMMTKLNEDCEHLTQLEWALERDQPHPHGWGARGHTREVYQ